MSLHQNDEARGWDGSDDPIKCVDCGVLGQSVMCKRCIRQRQMDEAYDDRDQT